MAEGTRIHVARDDIHQLVHLQTSLDESNLDYCIHLSVATEVFEDGGLNLSRLALIFPRGSCTMLNMFYISGAVFLQEDLLV